MHHVDHLARRNKKCFFEKHLFWSVFLEYFEFSKEVIWPGAWHPWYYYIITLPYFIKIIILYK